MKNKSEKLIKALAWIIFTIYIIMLFYFMFFSERYGRTIIHSDYNYNLELLREIKRFWNYRELLGLESVVVNLAGNVAGFIPFGIMIPFLSKKRRNFFLVTLLTLEFSLLIEVTQLVTKAGSFDVDDLLLNTLGGSIGYMVFGIVNSFCKRWRKKDAKKEKEDIYR
ncbi:MAG: VanZ family protein [Lachnospiraceae bacterium]|nr:VanZ family protein [Lachnospiraceae bacterium]